MNKAIFEFGQILKKSCNYFTIGNGHTFAWVHPGDIAICGAAPEDPNGRACLVQVDGEPKGIFTRLFIDGDTVTLCYMDGCDVYKTVPRNAVKIQYEVLGITHMYEQTERLVPTTAWEKRVSRAVTKWGNKFTNHNCVKLMQQHRDVLSTLTRAFSMGYDAGRKDRT